MSFERVAIIGLGLLGGSIGLAVREHIPGVATTGYDSDPQVRERARERGLAGTICETAGEAVTGADLVILCVPVGAMVDTMDVDHHDLVLAVTSHIPHLIAYTIVGTASELENVTRSEVIKYSAGGFRDFTRIAASDPTMWRDVFLNNRDAVLEMLDRFLTDLALMREAIRARDGETMFDTFSRTRSIRRSIVALGQDDARPDFGRKHNGD